MSAYCALNVMLNIKGHSVYFSPIQKWKKWCHNVAGVRKFMKLFSTVVSALTLSVSSLAFSADTDVDDPTIEVTSASEREDKFRFVVMPFYDPSTDAGITVMPIWAFYPDESSSEASSISLSLIYTQNDSYIGKINTDFILMNDVLQASTEIKFSHTNMTFDVLDTGAFQIEANAAHEELSIDGDVFYKLHKNFFVGLGSNIKSTRYIGKDNADSIILAAVDLPAEFQTDVGIRASIKWDSRDHYYYPHNGVMWKLVYEEHAEWMGNDPDNTYSSLYGDYRHYYSLDDNEQHVLATKWVGRYLLDAENAPTSAYTTYGRQGREIQRGFVVGDYTASHLANVEFEYRYAFKNTGYQWLDKSILVAIAGAGKVFGEQLVQVDGCQQNWCEKYQKVPFKEADTLSAVGVGYRYTILPKERINLKMDVTYNSDQEWIAYFGIGESI
jgi:outer membrane protein assembly factor BamA